MKYCKLLLTIVCLFCYGSVEAKVTHEDVIFTVECSYNRAEGKIDNYDPLGAVEVFKKKLTSNGMQIGLTREQLICSTAVALKDIEPDPEKWPDLLLEKGRRIEILLYALSLYGNPEALSAVEKIFYDDKYDGYKEWAVITLLKSPVPWYPIVKKIISQGSSSMKSLIYCAGIKNWIYLYKKPGRETIDSINQLVCDGFKEEAKPTGVYNIDRLLCLLNDNEYKYSKERYYFIKMKFQSKEVKDFLKVHSIQRLFIQQVSDTLQNQAKNNQLHSSARFRKYFGITEDLDTVDIFIHGNEPEEKK